VSREEEKYMQGFDLASPKKSDLLRNMSIDGRVLLKLILKEYVECQEMDLSGPG